MKSEITFFVGGTASAVASGFLMRENIQNISNAIASVPDLCSISDTAENFYSNIAGLVISGSLFAFGISAMVYSYLLMVRDPK